MGVKIESRARRNLQAKKIPACMSTDGCQPLMAISRDKKTKTIMRASDRAAVIDLTASYCSRHPAARNRVLLRLTAGDCIFIALDFTVTQMVNQSALFANNK